MIGTLLNQIRQARALELRELTVQALAEAQLQSYAAHAIDKGADAPSNRHSYEPRSPTRRPSKTKRQRRESYRDVFDNQPNNARLPRRSKLDPDERNLAVAITSSGGRGWTKAITRQMRAVRAMQVARSVGRGSRRGGKGGVRIGDPMQFFCVRPPIGAFADEQLSLMLLIRCERLRAEVDRPAFRVRSKCGEPGRFRECSAWCRRASP
jgi:hypothetical protein